MATPMTGMSHEPRGHFIEMQSQPLALCTVSVCLGAVSRKKDLPILRKLEMTPEVAGQFHAIALAVGKKYLSQRKNAPHYIFREYAPESKPDAHEVEYLDLADCAEIVVQTAALEALDELKPFVEAEKAFVRNLRFYVIVLQFPDAQIPPAYFFRLYSPTKVLGQTKRFGIIHRAGAYDKVTEPIMLFDENIDCLCWGQHLFILKKDNFQRIFQFFERLQKTARATLERIRLTIPIANFDEFADDCQNNLMKLAKVRSIMNKPYMQNVTLDDIKLVIARRNLNIRIEQVDDRGLLVYDSADPWVLLRLLNDDYLTSLLTGRDYEVEGKRDLTA